MLNINTILFLSTFLACFFGAFVVGELLVRSLTSKLKDGSSLYTKPMCESCKYKKECTREKN